MTIVHQLTGYSRDTERVKYEVAVPEDHLGYLRDVFGVAQADDPDLAGGAYPLPDGRIDQLMFYLRNLADPHTCEWFLEAYEQPQAVRA